ncbi:unnamed protein product [Amoebophrya sp. A25]|nr:unnamed protein product [Amoebophrya sp. A25]|eukprot:GSA25T00026131001.1
MAYAHHLAGGQQEGDAPSSTRHGEFIKGENNESPSRFIQSASAGRSAIPHKKEATMARQKSRKLYAGCEDVLYSDCSWAVSAYCRAATAKKLSVLEPTSEEHRALPELEGLARCMGGALAKHDIVVKHMYAAGAGSLGGMQEVLDGGPTKEAEEQRRRDCGGHATTPGTRYWGQQIDNQHKRRKGVDSNPKLNLQSQLYSCLGKLQNTFLWTTVSSPPALRSSEEKTEVNDVWDQCLWKFYQTPLTKVVENHL